MPETLDRDGYTWLRGAVPASELEPWKGRVELALKATGASAGPNRAGVRIPNRMLPEAEQMLASSPLADALGQALECAPRLVRILYFDKSPEAPWALGFHRDTMIPVREHRPSRTLVSPSLKAGVPHVRATLDILKRMLAVRIHLDSADKSNGALRVVPGSHRTDSLDDSWPPGGPAQVLCIAEAGDILLMRPLLLHASSKPAGKAHRRVLHLEVRGDISLPDGFEWHA